MSAKNGSSSKSSRIPWKLNFLSDCKKEVRNCLAEDRFEVIIAFLHFVQEYFLYAHHKAFNKQRIHLAKQVLCHIGGLINGKRNDFAVNVNLFVVDVCKIGFDHIYLSQSGILLPESEEDTVP